MYETITKKKTYVKRTDEFEIFLFCYNVVVKNFYNIKTPEL